MVWDRSQHREQCAERALLDIRGEHTEGVGKWLKIKGFYYKDRFVLKKQVRLGEGWCG